MCVLVPCVCVCAGVPSLWMLWDLRLKDNNPADSLVSGDVKDPLLVVLVEESRTRELTRGHSTVFPVLKEMRK